MNMNLSAIGKSLKELATLLASLPTPDDGTPANLENENLAYLEGCVARAESGNLKLDPVRMARAVENLDKRLAPFPDRPGVVAARGTLATIAGMVQNLVPQETTDGGAFADLELERSPLPGRKLRVTPTFIIGYRRSGTTLLSWLLDAHPNIAAVPENVICLNLLAASPGNPGEARPGIPHMVLAQHSAQRIGLDRSEFYGHVARLIDDLNSNYAAAQGKRRWVAKELFLHHSLDLLDLVLGYKARFIFNYRHGFDAAISASKFFGNGPTPLGGGLDLVTYLDEWIETNEAVLDFAERNPDRCHHFCYERFTANPEPKARALFEFLEEPWCEDIFQNMQRADHDLNLGDNKILATGGRILADRRHRWHSWPEPLKRQLGRRANATLERLGYEPVPT